jgi:hypothetical protein
MAEQQALEIKDFSGGMTDNFIGADLNKFQLGQNTFILPGRPSKIQSRYGSEIFDDDYYQVPFTSTAKRVDSLYRFGTTNVYQTMNKLYHIKADGFTEVTGPTDEAAFIDTVAQFDQCSYTEWNNHLLVTNDMRTRPVFIYKDSTDLKLRTIGLPAVDVTSIAMSAGVGAARGYAFVYAYTYTIDGVDFVERGPVSDIVTYTGSLTNDIEDLPALVNGSGENYDTDEIKLEIYRTADTGTTFYKVGQVTNGNTSFSDNVADADLDDGLLLYTDGEDLDYHQPPKCKYVVQLNGCAYYLNIEDSAGGIYANRLVQAVTNRIYAANEGNILDVDEAITGGAVAGQNVVVFTSNHVYRLDGIYDSAGGGGINRVELSRTVGCISHKSIVQTQQGCFWAAKDGFYFTNGYEVLRISEEIPNTYAASVANESIQKRIYGAYDPFNKRVYWAASSDIEQDDNDMLFVAHLIFGLKPDVPFTTWNGGLWPTNFAPASILFYDGFLVRGDSRGYLLTHEDGTLNDAKIDTTTTPDEWTQLPVIYDINSAAFDFGNVTIRKYVTRIVLYADSLARCAIGIFSNNDNTGQFLPLAEIRSNSPILWGDNDVVWGDSSIRWNYLPIVSGNRRFPSRGLRCSYKQVQITNSYTLIDSSDDSGTVSVNGAANTVTLNNAALVWDTHAVDYFISFAEDDYATEYLVTARTSDTVLTIEDTDGTLVTNATESFRLRGYRKNEALRLLSYSLIYQATTPTQTPYRTDT